MANYKNGQWPVKQHREGRLVGGSVSMEETT